MGLDILPKGGSGFRMSGASSFKAKLSRLVNNQGGEFGNMRDNQAGVIKALGKYAGVIRGQGGLSRRQQQAAILAAREADKKLSENDKEDLKKIVGYYARGQSNGAGKKPAVEDKIKPKPVKVRINRDPNNNLDFGALEKDVRPGLTPRANRAVSVAQTKRPGLSLKRSEPVHSASITQAGQGRAVVGIHQTGQERATVGIHQLGKPTGSDKPIPPGNSNINLRP